MKRFLLFAFIAFAFQLRSQTISAGIGSADVQIVGGGKLMLNGVEKGHILQDGTIQNAQNVNIGSVNDIGEIRNAANVIVGFFKPNYEVHNAGNVMIGYFRSTRQVFNSADVQLGTYIPEVKPSWSAVAYFFFQP
jgi:hypothetical protein